MLDTVFTSQSKVIRFADLNRVQSTSTGPSDGILEDDDHFLKVVWELRVPWLCEHFLDDKLDDMNELRNILAQPIKYMQMLGCVYGFLSKYKETAFLRQLINSQGLWRVECSPVARSSTTYDRRARNPHVVSIRQCFFPVGCRNRDRKS